MTRNYADLSPHDFEILVRDLLQEEFGVRMESFPRGKDGGVDIRLHHGGVDSIIIQCKHSPGRTFAQVRSELEREARKIGSKFTCRYMLVTSASLTRANKKEIARAFAGVRLRENDIIGVDDIDNLLSRHPRVETQNFKLWITSSAVLQHLLNSDLHLRSTGFVDRIIKRRRFYVHSKAHFISLDMLREHHVCVISGEPGIGKTTLAETLLVRHLVEGWEVHMASADVSEIERVWRPGSKQVFLYDDFLGQNSLLDSLNKNEDSRLVQIIERIAEESDKRLVMTTREYILRQARQIYPRLKSSPMLFENRIVLNLADYTRLQKAQIFYNHVHFADLGEEALGSILSGRNYLNVIRHPNFNPRVIELVASNFKQSGVPGCEFYRYAIGALDNPRELWESIFQDQLSQAERSLLVILATLRGPVEVSDLFKGVSSYEAAAGASSGSPHRLGLALKKLQGTFITVAFDARLDDQLNGIHPSNYSTVVELANPSFIDFISSYLSSHPGEISQVARGAAFFEQVETLVHWDLGHISDDQLIGTLMDAFFGRRGRVKIIPRLASGQQRVIMDALKRLEGAPSCYWTKQSRGSSGEVRQSASLSSRHLIMLILDAKYGRTLLSGRDLLAILAKFTRRIEAGNSLMAGREIRLISQLSAYSGIAEQVGRARNLLAAKRMKALNSPEDFQAVLSMFTETEVSSSSWSAAAEIELREKFCQFASEWDLEESGRVNTVEDCEESIGLLTSALEDFELPVDVPRLKERLTLLEEEIAQDLDFGEDDEPVYDRPVPFPAQSPVVRHYGESIDPVDQLFDSLGL